MVLAGASPHPDADEEDAGGVFGAEGLLAGFGAGAGAGVLFAATEFAGAAAGGAVASGAASVASGVAAVSASAAGASVREQAVRNPANAIVTMPDKRALVRNIVLFPSRESSVAASPRSSLSRWSHRKCE